MRMPGKLPTLCHEDEPLLPFNLTGWYETEALLRGGEDAAARAGIARLGAAVGDNRRYRLILLRSQAVLAEWDGDVAQALGHLQAALALAQAMGLPGEAWPILGELGRLYGEQGETEQATAAYREAAAIIRQLAETIDEEALRGGFWRLNRCALCWPAAPSERLQPSLRKLWASKWRKPVAQAGGEKTKAFCYSLERPRRSSFPRSSVRRQGCTCAILPPLARTTPEKHPGWRDRQTEAGAEPHWGHPRCGAGCRPRRSCAFIIWASPSGSGFNHLSKSFTCSR